MSSDGSRTTNSSRFSQFGLYRTIDARTEEFLRLSRKRQIRQGCACAAVSTAITVTVVITVLLVYEYTINIETSNRHKLKKATWRDIFNDSSTFDSKTNLAKVKIDPTTLKLLPIILKALTHNENVDNLFEETSTVKIKHKKEVGRELTEKEGLGNEKQGKELPHDDYLQKYIFTNYLRTPNSADYKPNYSNSNNLDYYSKIRKIRNYQKVLSMFDKMVNNRMTTSSELITEEQSEKSNRNELEMTSTSFPDIVIVKRPTKAITKFLTPVTVSKTTIEPTTTMPTSTKNTCCSIKLGILLRRLITSIQEVLPELSVMLNAPSCKHNISNDIDDKNIEETALDTEYEEVTDNTLLAKITQNSSSTENQVKQNVSIINYEETAYKIPVKHLEIKPQMTTLLKMGRKLNIRPTYIKNNLNFTIEQYNATSKEKAMKNNWPILGTTESTLINRQIPTDVFPSSTAKMTTSMTKNAKTVSRAETATNSRKTTMFTNRVLRVKTTPKSRLLFFNSNVLKAEASEMSDESPNQSTSSEEQFSTEKYLSSTISMISSSNFNPRNQLSQYDNDILKLIRNKHHKKAESKIPTNLKEPNTYLDHFTYDIHSSSQKRESKEVVHIPESEETGFIEQDIATIVKNLVSSKPTKIINKGTSLENYIFDHKDNYGQNTTPSSYKANQMLTLQHKETTTPPSSTTIDVYSNEKDIEIKIDKNTLSDIQIKFKKDDNGDLEIKFERSKSKSPKNNSTKTFKKDDIIDDIEIKFDSKSIEFKQNISQEIEKNDTDLKKFEKQHENKPLENTIPKTVQITRTFKKENENIALSSPRYTFTSSLDKPSAAKSNFTEIKKKENKTSNIAGEQKEERPVNEKIHLTKNKIVPLKITMRKPGNLVGKGYDLQTVINLARRMNRDRKNSAIVTYKGEKNTTQTDISSYMNWLDNVGHPINVAYTRNNTTTTVKVPWYLEKVDHSLENSTNATNQIQNLDMHPKQNASESATEINERYITWSNRMNDGESYMKKSTEDIGMEDIENEVQEIPITQFLESLLKPKRNLKVLPIKKISSDENKRMRNKYISLQDKIKRKDKTPFTPDITDNIISNSQSMLSRHRSSYLEIERGDWNNEIKETNY